MFISLNKKIIIVLIFIILIIVLVSFSFEESHEKKNKQFHVTLADPELYLNREYTETFVIEKGEYFFRFVPNGSSPKNLSITMNGNSFNFSENFRLIGSLHQTGISEYYTWDYDGEKNILIFETQKVSITINPNGETLGSISVYILKN